MTAQNVTVPYEFFTGLDGKPLDAGYIYIGQENLDPETNPITVYWDDALSITAQQPIRTQLGFPVRAGSPAGIFAGSKYSITVKNSRGELVYTNTSGGDSLPSDLADSSDVAKGDALVAVKRTLVGSVATTVHKFNEDRIVNVKTDFGAKGDGTTDDQPAIQAAVDSGATQIYFPAGTYKFGAPVVIPEVDQSLTFVGENMTKVYLAPKTVDISVSGGPNALFINQKSDGKLSFDNLRFWADVAYTGWGVWAYEGTALGVATQAIISGRFDKVWVDMGSLAAGFFYGGMIDCWVVDSQFEFMKVAFKFVGVRSHCHFQNNLHAVFYGPFIDASDVTGSGNVTNTFIIDGLSAVQGQQGTVLTFSGAESLVIDNVLLQAATAAISPVALLALVDSNDVVASNLEAIEYPGGTGQIGTAISCSSTQARFSNVKVLGSAIGFEVTGTSRSDLDLIGCDFIKCNVGWQNSALTVGRVQMTGCRITGSSTRNILFNAVGGIDLELQSCFIVDAGLGSGSPYINIDLNTTGFAVLRNCTIGKIDGTSNQSYWFDANGSGEFIIQGNYFIGTPGTGFKTGAQLMKNAGNAGVGQVFFGSAAPTTGTWKQGDRMSNSSATVGQPKGWLCTVAGTPGTWVSEGNL